MMGWQKPISPEGTKLGQGCLGKMLGWSDHCRSLQLPRKHYTPYNGQKEFQRKEMKWEEKGRGVHLTPCQVGGGVVVVEEEIYPSLYILLRVKEGQRLDSAPQTADSSRAFLPSFSPVLGKPNWSRAGVKKGDFLLAAPARRVSANEAGLATFGLSHPVSSFPPSRRFGKNKREKRKAPQIVRRSSRRSFPHDLHRLLLQATQQIPRDSVGNSSKMSRLYSFFLPQW